MITIHGVPGSPYGRAVMIACQEKGAAHRLSPLSPGGTRTPEYLARHPFGRMPVIDHDGFGLYETQAILRYIDQIGQGPSLVPADPKAAARMNQVIGIIDWYFFADNSAKTLAFNRVVAPKLGFPADDAAAVAAIPKARHCVEVLAGFLTASPYFAGDSFSLADIHAGPQLDMLRDCAEGADLIEGTPIAAWLDGVTARPSFQATTWERLLEAA
jgi:glutathione S-transferase